MTELDIIKHEKEIYSTISKGGKFVAAIKKILVEIVIIVIAVSISIIFHSLEKHYEENKKVEQFLSDIKINLKEDRKVLEIFKKKALEDNDILLNNLKTGNYEEIKTSLITTGLDLNNTDFEVFKISGDFALTENRRLKASLLEYYQKNYYELTEVEKMYNSESLKLMDFVVKSQGTDASSKEIYRKRSLIISQFYLIRAATYDKMLNTNKKLAEIIEKELEK